jgi:hypothetical protein
MDATTPETVLTVRVPTTLVSALDQKAARRRAEQPGHRVRRADVIRSLLLAALDALVPTREAA